MKTRSSRSGLLLAISLTLFILPGRSGAEEEAKPDAFSPWLDLKRVFDSGELDAQSRKGSQWAHEGSRYYTREKSDGGGGMDIVCHDPQTGECDVVVRGDWLIPAGQTSPLSVERYTFSRDGSRLLIYTNSRKVWRQNTRGDYWILDISARWLRQLGGDLPAASMMFATLSPDSTRVAYVHDNNLYVQDLHTLEITPLTHDENPDLINGTFDWVYEEEFGLRQGFRWSPDSRFVAYWQLDTTATPTFHMINNTDGLYPRLIPFKYPKVGEANAACRVGVVSAGGGDPVWMAVPGDASNHYIAYLEWVKEPQELVLQQFNRLQNTVSVMRADPETGDVQCLYSDRDEAWLDLQDDLHWLENDQRFLWLSERDGWRQVYSVSRSGEKEKRITPADCDVVSIEGIDEKRGWMYYIASPDNPTQRYLFRVRLNGKDHERVTPTEFPGMNHYSISEDAQYAFHSHSALGTPPTHRFLRLENHEVLEELEDNSELRGKLAKLKLGESGFFRVGIEDGVELDGWYVRPPDFDPQKKYPVLFYVYGEPAGSTVQDRWGGKSYLWYQMLAQKGYVVMSVDNRGTRVPRGREWRKCIYRQVGILASADQAAAVRAIGQKYSWMDEQRVAIWGWSGGGSMTLNALFRYPEVYHTGMAVAFIANQRYYDTIYQERYMGLPSDNVEGFTQGSPIHFAHQLQGNLLLIHGTADDNVHYQSAEALANELIRHNKRFSMMVYPNRAHGISEGKNTRLHLYGTMTDFLLKNMPAQEN